MTDSNTWGGHSGDNYTFGRRADGTTEVRVVNVRAGKNLKGHVLALVLRTVGKGVLVKEFAKTTKAIEGRSCANAGSDTPTTATTS